MTKNATFIIFVVQIIFLRTAPCLPFNEGSIKTETGRLTIEQSIFQREMLKVFGHEQKPHPNLYNIVSGASEAAVNFMYELYNSISRKEVENSTFTEFTQFFGDDKQRTEVQEERSKRSMKTFKADSAISFITQEFSARPNATDSNNALYFDLQTNYDMTWSTFSELRIHYNNKNNKYQSVTLYLYAVSTPNVHRLLGQQIITQSCESKWIIFIVTNTVVDWKRLSGSNHGLVITMKTLQGDQVKLRDGGIIGSKGNIKQRPFLVVFFKSIDGNELLADTMNAWNNTNDEQDTEYERRRRSVDIMTLLNLDETKKVVRQIKSDPNHASVNTAAASTPCGMSQFYVDFIKLKWEWIIAPKGYEAGVCSGRCSHPLTLHINATAHAIIQSLQSLVTYGKYPEPCCAPLYTSPLTVLLVDTHGNAVIKQYTNMIVQSCGCF